MAFSTSPIVGANLGTTSTEQQFALGTRVIGDGGTEYVYAKAGGTIRQYDTVVIDSAFSATALSVSNSHAGGTPGFPQIAFSTNEYGWIPVKSSGTGLKVRVSAATSKAAQLWACTTAISAGVLNGTASATGSKKLNGALLVTSAASAGVRPTIVATSPWFTP